MDSMKWTAEQAMEAIKVPAEERGKYASRLYTADRQDLQWCLRESTWLAVCSRVALQI